MKVVVVVVVIVVVLLLLLLLLLQHCFTSTDYYGLLRTIRTITDY